MDAAAILDHIRRTYAGLDILVTPDADYIYYDPARDTPHDKRQPFATIVRGDVSDQASDLARRGLFRLNLGVERPTYRAMFGPEPKWDEAGKGHDFTKPDALLPHPVYAPLSWICIVAPSEESWPRVRGLLDEAYAKARRLKRDRTLGAT